MPNLRVGGASFGLVGALALAVLLLTAGGTAAAPGDAISVEKAAAKDKVVTVIAKNTGTTELLVFQGTFPEGTRVTGLQALRGGTVCGGGGAKPNVGECLFGEGQRWRPGEAITFTFTLEKALPKGAKVRLCASSVFGGSDACAEAAISKCQCQKIDVETKLTDSLFVFEVRWTMDCSGGAGGCSGEIDVSSPEKSDIRITKNQSANKCSGTCGKAQSAVSHGRFVVHTDWGRDRRPENRRLRSFPFRIQPYCLVDGKDQAQPVRTMTLRFDQEGVLNRKRSDLDADGKPDGTQK